MKFQVILIFTFLSEYLLYDLITYKTTEHKAGQITFKSIEQVPATNYIEASNLKFESDCYHGEEFIGSCTFNAFALSRGILLEYTDSKNVPSYLKDGYNLVLPYAFIEKFEKVTRQSGGAKYDVLVINLTIMGTDVNFEIEPKSGSIDDRINSIQTLIYQFKSTQKQILKVIQKDFQEANAFISTNKSSDKSAYNDQLKLQKLINDLQDKINNEFKRLEDLKVLGDGIKEKIKKLQGKVDELENLVRLCWAEYNTIQNQKSIIDSKGITNDNKHLYYENQRVSAVCKFHIVVDDIKLILPSLVLDLNAMMELVVKEINFNSAMYTLNSIRPFRQTNPINAMGGFVNPM